MAALATSMNGEVLLSVRDVSLTLGAQKILDKVCFDVVDRIRPGVCTGQLVGLLGPWISLPSVMVPGTAMGSFPGVADRDKDDIVAYLAAQK